MSETLNPGRYYSFEFREQDGPKRTFDHPRANEPLPEVETRYQIIYSQADQDRDWAKNLEAVGVAVIWSNYFMPELKVETIIAGIALMVIARSNYNYVNVLEAAGLPTSRR